MSSPKRRHKLYTPPPVQAKCQLEILVIERIMIDNIQSSVARNFADFAKSDYCSINNFMILCNIYVTYSDLFLTSAVHMRRRVLSSRF